MICKICGAWFDPYQIIDGKRVADAYICKPCMIREAEEFGGGIE